MEADYNDFENDELFKEPDDYYQPEKPATFTKYTLKSGRQFKLRLVGHSPLWGHLLWNASQVVADYLEHNCERLVKKKSVLELGAGAGLPSLACAVLGSSKVVVTDYPDRDLIDNLQYNINANVLGGPDSNVAAEGYLWGNAVDSLQSHLNPPESSFDLLILADILFNHSEHEKLVATLRMTMNQNRDACALVFFTPYRPWLLEKDLHFFDLARDAGFEVEKVLQKTMEKVMFEKDPGNELLRRTVFGYELRWKDFSDSKLP